MKIYTKNTDYICENSKKALMKRKNMDNLIDFNETVCYAEINITKPFSKKYEMIRNGIVNSIVWTIRMDQRRKGAL